MKCLELLGLASEASSSAYNYFGGFLMPKCLVHYIFPSLSDIQEFHRFVNGIRAEGGQDEAEDVFGGLDAVLKLNWQRVGTKVSDPFMKMQVYSNLYDYGDVQLHIVVLMAIPRKIATSYVQR